MLCCLFYAWKVLCVVLFYLGLSYAWKNKEHQSLFKMPQTNVVELDGSIGCSHPALPGKLTDWSKRQSFAEPSWRTTTRARWIQRHLLLCACPCPPDCLRLLTCSPSPSERSALQWAFGLHARALTRWDLPGEVVASFRLPQISSCVWPHCKTSCKMPQTSRCVQSRPPKLVVHTDTAGGHRPKSSGLEGTAVAHLSAVDSNGSLA